MHPAVVLPAGWIVLPRAVVEQAQLVAHVHERQPPVGEGDRVEQQDAAQGELERELVAALARGLEPGQRSRRPARARLADVRLELEARAAREAAREVSGVEVREK